MSAKINPQPGYVVAEIVKQEQKTESGLYIAESARKKFNYAKVIEVGKGVANVKKNDLIIYKDYGDDIQNVEIDNKEYIVLKDSYVFATITN